MEQVQIQRDAFHGEWNYLVSTEFCAVVKDPL
jgi:hypothetical protein